MRVAISIRAAGCPHRRELRTSRKQLFVIFSVDQSVFLPAGDQAGIERLIQYMTRCLSVFLAWSR